MNDEAKISQAVEALVDVGWMPIGARDVVRQVMQDPKRIPDVVRSIEDAWRGSTAIRRSKIDRAVAMLESFAVSSTSVTPPDASVPAHAPAPATAPATAPASSVPDASPAKANG